MNAPRLRERIAAARADEHLIHAVHLATLHKVDARAASLQALKDVDSLRDLAARIKQHTLDHLNDYLRRFVENVQRHGGHVHLAPDSRAACQIICDIAAAAGARLAVKAKSMVTEEIELNRALEAAGVRVVETDLGEFIVQLDRDRPSHIVTPIIHKNRRQVARAMQRELGCPYTEDPAELTAIARAHLRALFRRADLGITGVNFAVAQTGTLCICTNEGNARMTLSRPRIHIAVMGIEKLVPRLIDLVPLLKLLARSSTGQPLTVYTSLVTGPRRGEDADGPQELHVVLLDNGRSRLLGSPYAPVLRCIRCGACLNACPVYRNIGGHAYDSVYPGPIGSLVTPLLSRMRTGADLPRISSLCGACREACPVRIDIPELLVALRRNAARRQPLAKRLAMRMWCWIVRSPARYAAAQLALRWLAGPGEHGWVTQLPVPADAWTRWRDLPVPSRTFRERWREALQNV